jgi:hypothetical protein
MFNGRFSLSGKEKLFQILCEVLESGLDWTWKSPTMCSLKRYLSDPYKFWKHNIIYFGSHIDLWVSSMTQNKVVFKK